MGEPRSNQKKTPDATVPQIPAEVVAGFLGGENERKTERFEVRLSESQVAALTYVADQLGITPSEVLRRATFAPERLSQMVTRREWEMAGDYVAYRNAVLDLKAALVEVHRQIAKLGVNVNQISRRINSGGDGMTKLEMQSIKIDFDYIRDRCDKLNAKADRLLESYESLRPFEGE